LRRARDSPAYGQQGGGFPNQVLKDVPPVACSTAASISARCASIFSVRQPDPGAIIEPGRGMVGNAGMIETEVVLISRKSRRGRVRWGVSRHRQVRRSRRDDGRVDRYAIRTPHRRGGDDAVRLAGPTCDNADVLYEKLPYPLPVTLEIGDSC